MVYGLQHGTCYVAKRLLNITHNCMAGTASTLMVGASWMCTASMVFFGCRPTVDHCKAANILQLNPRLRAEAVHTQHDGQHLPGPCRDLPTVLHACQVGAKFGVQPVELV